VTKDTKRESFEELYRRLEESVARLEQGGLSLEEAIAAYEEGMRLATACQERLAEAEVRITRLKQRFGSDGPADGAADSAFADLDEAGDD
jgi:exodeoxyribonuclease VII small subunit